MAFAPSVNDVDCSLHVVATDVEPMLRIWQTVVAPIVWLGSSRLKLAIKPGSCVIVTVWPPMLTVPEREDDVPLAAAVIVSVPLPVVVVLGTVRNDELLVAFHEQAEVLAVTAIDTVPPPLLAFDVVGETETEQPLGASVSGAACEKATVLSLTTMLAARAAPVLAATLYATVPLPVPDAPDVIVMKLALD